MEQRYTIGGLATATGVPPSTIRYYERRDLLRPVGRSPGNYRLYDEEVLDRLGFIRAAQMAGFTLADIATLLRFRDGDLAPCRQVQALIAARLERVDEQVRDLQRARRTLRKWLDVCRQAERTGTCGVLEGLSPSATRTSRKSRDCP